MFEMFMSVHNTINLSNVIYKCRVPILQVFWPCQHLPLCNNANPFKFVLDHCCSVPLFLTPQSRKRSFTWYGSHWHGLVECGRFRKCLGNNPGRPEWKHRIGRMVSLYDLDRTYSSSGSPVEKLHFGVMLLYQSKTLTISDGVMIAVVSQ